MSEFNIEVEGGKSVRLPTAGKYCDRNIVVTATGGGGDSDFVKSFVTRTITEFSDESIEEIGDHAFGGCTQLSTISIPKVTKLGEYAFYKCAGLIDVKLNRVSLAGTYAFANCTSLKAVQLTKLTTAPNYMFYGDTVLETAIVGLITQVGASCFANCKALNYLVASTSAPLRLDNVTAIGSNAFAGCSSLPVIDLPQCTRIGTQAFANCTSLQKVQITDLTVTASSVVNGFIEANTFSGCTNLTQVIIYNWSGQILPLKNVSAFRNTPIANGAGYIYVTPQYVNAYKSATNWSTYAAQIKSTDELT